MGELTFEETNVNTACEMKFHRDAAGGGGEGVEEDQRRLLSDIGLRI